MASTSSQLNGFNGHGPNKSGAASDRTGRSNAEPDSVRTLVDHQQHSSQLQTVQIQGPSSSSLPLAGYSRNVGLPNRGGREQNTSLSGEERAAGANGARRPRSFSRNINADKNQYSREATDGSTSGDDIFRRPRTESPENYRRSILNKVPEEIESSAMPPAQSRDDNTAVENHRNYGSIGYGDTPARFGIDDGSSRNIDGNLSYDDDSELTEEEEEWILDEELEKQGLYRGNYKNLLLLYTLVPISALLAFVSLAVLPVFAFPTRHTSPFPYPPYLPFPLPEILVATALWSLSYLLRDFLYAAALSLTSSIPFPNHRCPKFIPVLTSIVSAILQSASTLFIRQLAIPILLIPYYSTEHLGVLQPSFFTLHSETAYKHHFPTWQDGAFRRVWWTALGWAAVEAVVGIRQGYENIGLYKDVLVSVNRIPSKAGLITDTGNRREPGLMAENQRGSPRERTPSDRQPLNDVDITPTQRDWDTQPQPFSQHGNGETRPQQQGRQLSSSSLSSDSILRQYNVGGLQSSGILGESQPLLPINATLPPLTRHMTNDSERIMAENEVERDLEALIALKNREELEEIYGIPFIRIPVFLSCLHRINSILSSLGATLLLTAAYMRSTFAYHPPSPNLYWLSPDPTAPAQPFRPSNTSLFITFPVLLVVQALLTFMHTPWIMPRLGIHTFVYIGSMVSLGLLFGGLGVWEALS